jgi:hypothetical protein
VCSSPAGPWRPRCFESASATEFDKEDGWEMPQENGDLNLSSLASEAVDFEAERQAARKTWAAQTTAQVSFNLSSQIYGSPVFVESHGSTIRGR